MQPKLIYHLSPKKGKQGYFAAKTHLDKAFSVCLFPLSWAGQNVLFETRILKWALGNVLEIKILWKKLHFKIQSFIIGLTYLVLF